MALMSGAETEIIEEDTLLAFRSVKACKGDLQIGYVISLLTIICWLLIIVVNPAPLALKFAVLVLQLLKLVFEPQLFGKSRLAVVPEGICRTCSLPFRKHTELYAWDSIKLGLVTEERQGKKSKAFLSFADESGKLVFTANPRRDEKLWIFVEKVRQAGCLVHVVRNKNRLGDSPLVA